MFEADGFVYYGRRHLLASHGYKLQLNCLAAENLHLIYKKIALREGYVGEFDIFLHFCIYIAA